MPAFNFKKQFVELVESEQKTQTIRALRADGNDPKEGQTAYLYTGMRTNQCRKLGEATIVHVQKMTIKANGDLEICGHIETEAFRENLARRDGFKSFSEMRDFFDDAYGLPFHGNVIEWDFLS